MDTSKVPILQGLYKPYIIVERRRRKIGIIGLITTDTKVKTINNKITIFDFNYKVILTFDHLFGTGKLNLDISAGAVEGEVETKNNRDTKKRSRPNENRPFFVGMRIVFMYGH